MSVLIKYNNKILTVGGNSLSISPVDPYNPLGLPYYTVRAQFSEGYTPSTPASGSATQVSSSPNVWDLTYFGWDWSDIFKNNTDLLAVLGANTHGQYKNVDDMSSMFDGCTNLTSVALFDTSSVVRMRNMFFNCKKITTIPDFDTTRCWDFAQMFYHCETLSACPNISTTYRSQSVTLTVNNMFAGCYAITSVPLLDLNGADTTTSMFHGCWSLTTVPLFDLSTVTNASSMFEGCAGLTAIPQFNLSSATNLNRMFCNCSALTAVPLIDTRSVLSMKEMFDGCSSLASVALLNTASVENFQSMFYDCTSLAAVPSFDTGSATNVSYMFSGCSAVSSGTLSLYQQMSSQATPPSTYENCFRDCGSNTVEGQAELAQIPRSWGGTQNEYQNTYYLQINAASYNQIAFCDLHVNGAFQTLTSAQINDGGWTSIANTDLAFINNGGKYKEYGDGFRAYFTSASGDVTNLSYYASKSDSYIASLNCTAILYGKKIGSNTWTEVKRTTYTQANNKYVSMRI